MSKKFIGLVIIILVIAFFMNYKSVLKVFYPRQYQDIVKSYSDEYRLDDNLVYSIIKIESKFDTYAKSKKDAAGLMQITPQTAEYIARLIGKNGYQSDDLFDAKTNIKFGCYYFSKLLRDFDGNLNCALAAYNGGEGNVRKWMTINRNGKRTLSIEDIPYYETKQYVKLVTKNYRVYQDLYSNSKEDFITNMINLMKNVLSN